MSSGRAIGCTRASLRVREITVSPNHSKALRFSNDARFFLLFFFLLAQTDDANGVIKPSLASSWSSAVDANNVETITFTLRTGVKFHDGADWNCAGELLNPFITNLVSE
jgi:ABC-type transport system substrate-binding protein